MTRPILEYAGTIYAPIISDKQLTALQVKENQGLRIATGCTSDTNINHIHDETKILPIEKHLRLHSSLLRQKASHPDHPLHRLTTQPQPPRLKKKTIFNNNQYTLNIDPDPTHAIDENTIKRNMKTIHTTIVQDHLSNRPINKLLNRPPPDIDKKEETLPHSTRRKLSQLRTNKSPLLMTYLHKIDPANHPAANCPLCNDPNHDSLHLFNCPDIPTTLTVWDLWTDPVGVAALLDVWGRSWEGPERGSEILCVLTHGMGSTPPPPTTSSCGRQTSSEGIRWQWTTGVNRQQVSTDNRCQRTTDNRCQRTTGVNGQHVSTDNRCQRTTGVNGQQVSTDNRCQRTTGVNGQQVSTDNRCQRTTGVNGQQVSTDNRCQRTTGVNGQQVSTHDSNH